MGYKEQADKYAKATGFQVSISGGASESSTDGAWKAVRGGALRFNENSGVTTGRDQFMNTSLGQREWEDITLIGPVTKTRKAMLQWFLDTVAGKDHRRELSVIILGPDGKETHRYDFMDTFLTSYSLTPLDSESETECEETIEVCVGYSKNLLTQ